MRYVIDASVAAEYLLRTDLGISLAELIESADLAAPSLLDVEVISILRRAVLRDILDEERALAALQDLEAWPVDRIPVASLLTEAWSYRHNVSAYDAFYVVVARATAATLLTADGPLSRAPNLGIVVQNVRLS